MTTLDESAARRARHGARTIAGTLRTARHARDPTPRYTEGNMHYHITTSPSPPSFPPRLTILTLISLIYTPTFVIRDRPYIHLRIHPPLFDSTLDSLFCPLFSIDTPTFCELGSRPSPTDRARGRVRQGRVRQGRPPSPGRPLARMGRTRSVSAVPTANRRGCLRGARRRTDSAGRSRECGPPRRRSNHRRYESRRPR